LTLPSAAITLVETDMDTLSCFDLLQVLRPHLTDPEAATAQITRQRAQGYRLLAARAADRIVGLAGFRYLENLVHGRFVYVDDLVVAATERKSGVGAMLLDAIALEAEAEGCVRFVLDTALTTTQAQRFYFGAGLAPIAFHFARRLGEARVTD
jgi:GNAT superfamily N-acetyltransferase